MSSSTEALRGLCPAPFFQESVFPDDGGCFEQRTQIASWVNLAAFILSVYLVVSFIVLPVKYTHRHYLSVCATIAVVFIELAFIIPLIAKPEQCFNEITPNDMRSSGACAVSGAFLLFGGWAAVIWVFCRALALHLQICWEVVPGHKFFYSSLALGWIIPVIGLAVTLGVTGVSFRFGQVCHINHKAALQDFWGPLLAFTAIGLVLQFITIGYCVQVYVKSLFDDGANTTASSQAPTYSSSMRTMTARQAYRRVKRVIQLQWRGATIVIVILAEIVFFAVVFVSMDNSSQLNQALLDKAAPWLTCLAVAHGDKNRCLSYAKDLVQSEGVVLAVLVCLGLSGFWCLVFFGRWSMTEGWIDMFKRRFQPNHEFVSADARYLSNDPRTYEMLSGGGQQLNIKPPDRVLTSPTPGLALSPPSDAKQEYTNWAYTNGSTVSNYSYPRSSQQHLDWDPTSTHARSGGPVPKAGM